MIASTVRAIVLSPPIVCAAEAACVASSRGVGRVGSRSASEEAGKAVGEIAAAVSDVAQGAERQVRVVQSAREATDEVSVAVQQSAASAQETAQAAEETRVVAREGVRAAE
jgi:methyl-accepting chemotaxis protein